MASSHKGGLAQVAQSAFWFSISSLLVKLAGGHLPVAVILVGRCLTGWSMCLWSIRRRGVSVFGTNRKGLFLRGILGFGGLACSFGAYTMLPLSDAVALFYTNPIFAAVLAVFFLHEELPRTALGGIGMCLAGVLCVAKPGFLFGESTVAVDSFGVAVALAGAVFAGSAYTSLRALAGKEHPLTIVNYFYMTSLPLAGIWAAFTWVTPTWTEVLMLMGIGVVTQLAQLLLTTALTQESAAKASAGATIQVALTAVWGVLVFGEEPSALALGGAGLIVAGILLMRAGKTKA